MTNIIGRQDLNQAVDQAMNSVEITDIHTHLFPECFGELSLYGIDELLTYHYLVAEAMRHLDMDSSSFFSMDKSRQAECVWKTLFVDSTPVSESARSVITIFKGLGLDVNRKDLNYYREFFSAQKPASHIDRILKMTGIKCLVMTNDPLDEAERRVWEKGYQRDERFKSALRTDRLLNDWEETVPLLQGLGYGVHCDLSGSTLDEIKRFLLEWVDKMEAVYCSVSLPPDFSFSDGSAGAKIIEQGILPVCRIKNIPFALMAGVKRGVNPELRLAGDSLGKWDMRELETLCLTHPENKFLVTMLSLENQLELVVTARKFSNLMVFGCWWYLNSPTHIEYMTKIRLEWLGTSFIPQHSDCRVLEQLISKWTHSKRVISAVLANQYGDLQDMGYTLTEEQIQRDVSNLFGGNFWHFVKKRCC